VKTPRLATLAAASVLLAAAAASGCSSRSPASQVTRIPAPAPALFSDLYVGTQGPAALFSFNPSAPRPKAIAYLKDVAGQGNNLAVDPTRNLVFVELQRSLATLDEATGRVRGVASLGKLPVGICYQQEATEVLSIDNLTATVVGVSPRSPSSSAALSQLSQAIVGVACPRGLPFGIAVGPSGPGTPGSIEALFFSGRTGAPLQVGNQSIVAIDCSNGRSYCLVLESPGSDQPGQAYLVSFTADGSLSLLGGPLTTAPDPTTLALSPDGTTALVGTGNGVVQELSLPTGSTVAQTLVPSPVLAAAYSLDGSTAMVAIQKPSSVLSLYPSTLGVASTADFPAPVVSLYPESSEAVLALVGTTAGKVLTIDPYSQRIVARTEAGVFPFVVTGKVGSPVFAVNLLSGTIQRVGGRHQATQTICPMPTYAAESPDGGLLYLACQAPGNAPGSVEAMDTSSLSVVAQGQTGVDPSFLAVSPDGSKVFVANSYSNTVQVYDSRLNLLSSIAVPAGPAEIALAPDGKTASVLCWDSNRLAVIDAGRFALKTTVGVPPFSSLVPNPGGADEFLISQSQPSIYKLSGQDGHVLAQAQIQGNPVSVAVSADGAELAAVDDVGARVYEISGKTLGLQQQASLSGTPTEAVIAPDDRMLVVGDTIAGTLFYLDLSTMGKAGRTVLSSALSSLAFSQPKAAVPSGIRL
jgi:YVTN family beta-propeller protein